MPTSRFTKLLEEGLEESERIRRGESKPKRVHVYERPDAKQIRESLGMSQFRFAVMLGISQRTLEGWEQGRRNPTGPARRLLDIAKRFPDAVIKTAFDSMLVVDVAKRSSPPKNGVTAKHTKRRAS